MFRKHPKSKYQPLNSDELNEDEETSSLLFDEKNRSSTPETDPESVEFSENLLSEVCLSIQEQPFLTKEQAMSLVFEDDVTGQLNNLFDYFLETIRREDDFRQNNTVSDVQYDGRYAKYFGKKSTLDSLIEKLQNAELNADIKGIIRTSLNSAELRATAESIGNSYLWADIGAKLNQTLNFKPQTERIHESDVVKKNQPISFISKFFGSKNVKSSAVGLSGVDSFGYTNLASNQERTERYIDKLIAEKGGLPDGPSTNNLSNS